MWSCESKENYLNTLKSDHFEHKWEKYAEIDHSDPNIAVKYISGALISAAEKTKVKCVRRDNNKDPPWFDDSCNNLKNNIRALGRRVKKNSGDSDVRGGVIFGKKET